MPRVAIIGSRGYPSYYGGFETAVRHLAGFLADAGWDVTVYSRPHDVVPDDPGRDPRVFVKHTWGLDSTSLSTLSYGLTSCWDAARKRPDVALVFNVANGFWLPLLRARQVPTVVNVDGIEWRRAKWNRLAKTVFRLGARASAKWATRLVCDSSAIADFWSAELGRGGEVIAYGADSPETDLPVEPGLAHRAYALVVARFVPENSIPEFFEAAPAIARQHDVVIVGSGAGELDAQAAALADANPRIRWLGHIADDRRLFSLWQHAGAYFHGHSVGGTNPALVQAMACGAPTVARDTVFTREVLADAGRFTSPEPTAIAQAVTALLSDPDAQDQLSARAVRRAHEAYSWARINSQYDQLLRQALDS